MNLQLSKNFGTIIRELRYEKKISQEELGFRSNLHRTYIGMIERGEWLFRSDGARCFGQMVPL